MNQIAVIYESKYGSTKKYAQWIAEELSCALFERKDINAEQLQNYDVIIYGGGLYAGGVSGFQLITKAFDSIRDKKLVLFTCGLADPEDADNVSHIQETLSKVMTEQMRRAIRVFHLRGGMDYAKLGFVHKSMMAMLHKAVMKKDPASLREEDRQMLETYGKTVDFTDRRTIEPILAYVRGLETPDGTRR